MSISDKLQTVAENLKFVYKAGYEKGKAEGDNTEEAYNEGLEAGKQAERENFWHNIWYNANGTFRRSFSYLFGSAWNAETFKPIYPNETINVSGEATGMFMRFNREYWDTEPIDLSEFCSHADFSKCTSITNAFQDARIKNLTIDLGNCASLFNTFNVGNGGYIDNLNIKVTEKCTTYANAFISASTLKTITFTEDSVIGNNISFAQSSMLSHDSLMSIINALKDFSGTTTTRTLTLHATAKARLSDEEKAIATQKGWTIA